MGEKREEARSVWSSRAIPCRNTAIPVTEKTEVSQEQPCGGRVVPALTWVRHHLEPGEGARQVLWGMNRGWPCRNPVGMPQNTE